MCVVVLENQRLRERVTVLLAYEYQRDGLTSRHRTPPGIQLTSTNHPKPTSRSDRVRQISRPAVAHRSTRDGCLDVCMS